MNCHLNSKEILSREKLFNKPLKGASEIGLIMTCFFLLLFVVFPLSLLVQEFSLYKNHARTVQSQTEMACYDIMTTFDFNALSEGYLADGDFEQYFKIQFEADLSDYITMEDLEINLKQSGTHDYLEVYYKYPYLTQVVFKSQIEKWVVVSLKVILPLNE